MAKESGSFFMYQQIGIVLYMNQEQLLSMTNTSEVNEIVEIVFQESTTKKHPHPTHKVKTKEKSRMMWATKWVIIFDLPPFIKK